MVDDILADKDNARRKMFEQAAGISKYKKRKRETLNKLKNTTEDLDRVEDLLFEINGNLSSLEKQAKLKEKYKGMSVDLAVLKSATLKESHKSLKKQLEEEEDKYRQVEIEVRQSEAKLESTKKANLDKEKALSDRQRELNSLVGRIRGMENDKKIFEQKITFNAQNKGKLGEQIQSSKAKITQLEDDINYYRENLSEEKRLEVKLEDKLEEAEKQLKSIKDNHGNLKSDLDVIMQEQQAVEREVYELEKQKAINTSRIENLNNESQRNDQDTQNRRAEVGELQGKIKELETNEQGKIKAVEELEAKEEKRTKDLKEAEEKYEILDQKVKKVNRDLDSKRNEYQLTKSMIENLEGFPESIRFLSNKKNWKNEAPLLSDLIYVDEAYRVAIENYLEPYLNHYVVNNLEEAFEAIQLLSKTQKGKANFFLLDRFTDYVAPMSMLPESQRAIELIQVDEQYRNLLSHLLENVIVTDSDEIAKDKVDDNIVLLSKSGRYIQKTYSISGGSVGLFEGKKIGRKKNLEMLEKAIQKGEKEQNKLQTEYFNLKELIEKLKSSNYTQQIRTERNIINQITQQKVTLATRLESFENFIKEVDTKRDENAVRIKELTDEINKIDAALNEKREIAKVAKDKISSTDGSFQKVAEQMSQASTNFNEKNIQFIQQQNKVTAFQRELTYREKQVEETKATLQRNIKSLAESDSELGSVREDIEKLERDLLTAYDQRKERESHLTDAEQNYFKARGAINSIDDRLRKLNKQRTDGQVLINQLKDKFTEVRFQLSNLSERLKIEFGIALNDVINNEPKAGLKEIELQSQVDRLKNRLDNYGEINPMAVEAYDEMKERFDTITVQKDDIIKAKEDLMDTIKEIEDTATKQFVEAFEKARVYFIDVFRSLFTEDDNCDLILLDPDNPLDSKIEIVAKPKGKRPQTISQLSGGEKTLTATALLFALYLLKPAPFCIFDEVDAPLDDANIEKFNKIIKKFSKDSQFIIVTHNKATMAAVDTIYGVYMAEQGVSGVSAVDFRSFKETGIFEAISN